MAAFFRRVIFIMGLLSLGVSQISFASSNKALSATAANQLKMQVTALYQQFAETTSALTTASQAFCTTPTQAGFDTLQTAWKNSMRAWLQTASVRFGAVQLDNRDLSIQFFPDKRGTLRRKVPALLNSDTPLTVEQLAQHGVATTGLPALEWLLFDSAEFALFQQHARRCDYVQAASQLLEQHATAVVAAWEETDSTTLDYATLLKSSLEWLELSKVVRLGAPMGKLKSGKQTVTKPHLAESWRSRHSLANLRASLHGWQQVWLSEQSALANALQAKGHSDLIEQLNSQVAAVLTATDEMTEPLYEAVQSAETQTRQQLQNLYFEVDFLASLVSSQLAEALEVQLGFNSLDGD